MDEFDAVARARGGRGGKGDQGDAGVARDSVVNQLLAKMDGISPLPAPTLVIGLTNKRSLIEPGELHICYLYSSTPTPSSICHILNFAKRTLGIALRKTLLRMSNFQVRFFLVHAMKLPIKLTSSLTAWAI